MAATTNYGWTKPTVGADDNAWGDELNGDLDSIDTDLKAVSDVADAALPATGGPISGSLTVAGGITCTGDFTVNRAGTPTTGFVLFGNTGVHYIGFDGTNFAVAGSGTFSAPSGGFVGALSGNVTGNVSGSSGSCTGNAASASTALKLGLAAGVAVDFDGTNIRFVIGGSVIAYVSPTTGLTNLV